MRCKMGYMNIEFTLMLISAMTSINTYIQLSSPTPGGDLEKFWEGTIT